MPHLTAKAEVDPVSGAIARSPLMADRRPIPLVSTSYRIAIGGGLADVVVRRTFRNVESESIEATLTFPLPVHAVLYELRARIGDRVLDAKARARSDARAHYEDAIDRGKTAVLHEELIKGVHLISVGHIAANSDVEVTARFALPLSHMAGRTALRIPTTIGQIYGTSPLQDCDDLLGGGPLQTADLAVECDSGDAVLVGGNLAGGRCSIALNRPIDVEIRNWRPRDIAFRSAAGACSTLRIAASEDGENSVDVAVLVDRSGSMGGVSATGDMASKHSLAAAALESMARTLRAGDKLHLFQFDDSAEEVGQGRGAESADLMRLLAGPRGGTEIGRAIEFACGKSQARDVLLLTDGMSHALDVQKLALLERCLTVVLIGEESLDANVGHLAVLSGGDIFIPVASQIGEGVAAAMRGLRRQRALKAGQWVRGGMVIEVAAADGAAATGDENHSRAAAALAASLRMASLDAASATSLAEAEGLVTHLTSLVLVDEEGAVQQGLPATRKVLLSAPPVASSSAMYVRELAMLAERAVQIDARSAAPRPARSAAPPPSRSAAFSPPEGRGKTVGAAPGRSSVMAGLFDMIAPRPIDLSLIRDVIDWTLDGSQLSTGDLSCLDSRIGSLILRASEVVAVRKAARRAKLTQVQIVIGVLAWAVRDRDRHAARAARTLLAGLSDHHIANIADRLGLRSGRRAA